ncbi:MAG: rod shape-determining protein MreC [Cyclobacteriaceae bacterium]|jgi:rod shape-determining protein MreC|nr:rod shape-determining protein MreC [Cyclobacteriaceae bacterium]
MERLFLFIYQYRAFFTFLVLQVICFLLLVSNNQYQSAAFFNSSNSLVAGINRTSQNFRDFFSLRETNQILAEENAYLKKLVEQRNQSLYQLNVREINDTEIINRFDFISARVVNNSVDQFKNHLTINKGKKQGIAPGMAVVSPQGIVGKVKTVSDNFSVVTSILNIDVLTSVQIKRTSHFATAKWNGANPDVLNLLYLPRHVQPIVGDTIITSGYNAIYPEGLMVGTISEINLKDEALFYDIELKLSQDFRRLTYLAVIKSNLKQELDSLQNTLTIK